MKKIYKINYHSFVDIITNSSTEIYSTANEDTIARIKELINCFLISSNQEITWEDLFEDIFLLPKKLDYLVYRWEDLFDDGILSVNPEGLSNEEDILKFYIDNMEEIGKYEYDSEDGPYNFYLVPKSEQYQELSNKLNKLIEIFPAEEFYS